MTIVIVIVVGASILTTTANATRTFVIVVAIYDKNVGKSQLFPCYDVTKFSLHSFP